MTTSKVLVKFIRKKNPDPKIYAICTYYIYAYILAVEFLKDKFRHTPNADALELNKATKWVIIYSKQHFQNSLSPSQSRKSMCRLLRVQIQVHLGSASCMHGIYDTYRNLKSRSRNVNFKWIFHVPNKYVLSYTYHRYVEKCWNIHDMIARISKNFLWRWHLSKFQANFDSISVSKFDPSYLGNQPRMTIIEGFLTIFKQ